MASSSISTGSRTPCCGCGRSPPQRGFSRLPGSRNGAPPTPIREGSHPLKWADELLPAARVLLLQSPRSAGALLRRVRRRRDAEICEGPHQGAPHGGQGPRADQQGRLPRPLRRGSGAGRLSRRRLVHVRRRIRHRRDHRPARHERRDRRAAAHLSARAVERLVIAGPAGGLEVAVNLPAGEPAGLALVAHPHPLQGGSLDNKVAQTLAKTFAAIGYAAVRFNFRGVGKSEGTFDEGAGETEDALAALAFARERFGDALPLALAGFSFGSYVQTRVAARVAFERLVLVGAAVGRFEVGNVPPETIVIHGEEDDVVALADVFAWARPQALPVVVFPGCGHFFHGRLVQLQQVITALYPRQR